MDAKYLEELFQKYQSGTLNAQEQYAWKTFITDTANDAQLLQLIDAVWDVNNKPSPVASELVKEKIYQEIVAQPQASAASHAAAESSRRLPRMAIAASITAFILAIGYYWYSRPTDRFQSASLTTDSIKIQAGQPGATLTLADGTVINLSDAADGKLTKQSGVTISKTADGKLIYQIAASEGQNSPSTALNSIATANGETYEIQLPDGSSVWLNSASSLSFSTQLVQQGQRRVKLQGEGYFEIAKDSKHPFIVDTEQQQVEVLGTHFNISAYKDQAQTKTTLLEGSVKILAFNSTTKLKPGQQALLDQDKILVKQIPSSQQAIAWKNGEFIFDNLSLAEIMQQISRWYNVEVSYVGKVSDPGFGGSIRRSKSIEEVLKALQKTQAINFKIEGRRVLVMP